jgi:predicted RNA-binding protein YlxR (DUF448 family)
VAATGLRGTRHPIRTCIGCRAREDRADLLRVVAVDSHVLPDPEAQMPGRGAWLHPGCLAAAESRRAFGRALRVSGPLDLRLLRTWISP